jgi:hypothetical protein
MNQLTDALNEWCDCDVAQYHLAVVLGVIAPDANFETGVKCIFWTDNPIGNYLFHTLNGLVSIGVLERREEPDCQYRWKPDFESLR